MADKTPLHCPSPTKERTPEDIGHMSGGEWMQHDPADKEHPGKYRLPPPGDEPKAPGAPAGPGQA